MKVTVTMIVTAKMVLFVAEIIVLLEEEVIFFPELIVAQPQQVKIFASDGAMWICENLKNYDLIPKILQNIALIVFR